MRYDFVYENSNGEKINLSKLPYKINIEPLIDYSWSYKTKQRQLGNKIVGFFKDIKDSTATLHVLAATAKERDEAIDYFNNVIEKDIYYGTAGKLWLGDWYTYAFITASKNSKWQYGVGVVKKEITISKEADSWYKTTRSANFGEQEESTVYLEEDYIKTYESREADSAVKSLTATIVPQQSGTGTPSPDNVRQISGWESVVTSVSGKNLLKVNSVNAIGKGITQTLNEDGTITLSGTSTDFNNGQAINGSAKFILPAGTYRFVDVGQTSGATFYYYLRVSGTSPWIMSGETFTVPEGSSGCWVVLYFPTNTEVSGTHGLMIVSENSAYDTYEPYTATTHTTDLGITVYGGTVDLVSGVLNAYPYYASYNGETLNGEWVCDRAVYAQGTTPPIGSQVALISGESTTYQLTPQTINTLSGVNNVWAESGDVTVTFRDDHGDIQTESGSIVTFEKNNALSGSGYDYAYDYMHDAQSQKIIANAGSIPCDFVITIQGYADSPIITIGDNTYAVNVEVPYGANLVIDSTQKTVIITLADGTKINAFGARDPDYYLFERIESGKNAVTWDGSYLWELLMIEERSEPRWLTD